MKKENFTFIESLIETSQKANRNNWLNDTYKKLSNLMKATAETGRRFVNINLNEVVVGAENLLEAAEMLTRIDKTLKENGFKVSISPEGDCYIAW